MPIPYYGDFAEDDTVNIPFNTFTSDDPSASVTITNLADADIKVHKDGHVDEIATDGATVVIDFDGVTGNHLVTIDTSVHADYATGSEYQVRMEGTTVDGATINAWIGAFSIERAGGTIALLKLIQAATITNAQGADVATDVAAAIGTDSKCLISTDAQDLSGTLDVNMKTITAGIIANASFNADVGSTAHGTNIIALACRKILEELNLDHLLKVDTTVAADGDLEAYCVAGTIMAHLLATGADATLFKASTDSLQGIRDVAPHGSAMVGTDNANTTVPDAAGTAPTAVEIQAEMEENAASILDTLRDDLADGGRLDLLLDAIKAQTDLVTAARMGALTDWIDGGRLDLLLDAIKVITDALTAAAATKLALSAGTIVTGTVSWDKTNATTTVFYSDDITEATADHFLGRIIIFTSGALQYQASDVTAYSLVSGEGKFTCTAWTEAPADNVTFIIV